MTDLQREWEGILESHGLPAHRGDAALDRACYLGNPRAYTDEKSEYSTFIDGLQRRRGYENHLNLHVDYKALPPRRAWG